MDPGAGEALPCPPFDFLDWKVSRCKAGRATWVLSDLVYVGVCHSPRRSHGSAWPWEISRQSRPDNPGAAVFWSPSFLRVSWFWGVSSTTFVSCFSFYPLQCFCQGGFLIKPVFRLVMEYTGHARGQTPSPRAWALSLCLRSFQDLLSSGCQEFAWGS